MWHTGQGTHVPLIVVGTGRWGGVMGVTSDVYPPPPRKVSQGRKKGARGSGLASLRTNIVYASLPAGEQKAQVTGSKELSLCPV